MTFRGEHLPTGKKSKTLPVSPDRSRQYPTNALSENSLALIDAESEKCLNGVLDASRHGNDIMWLMGWADWSVERQMVTEARQ